VFLRFPAVHFSIAHLAAKIYILIHEYVERCKRFIIGERFAEEFLALPRISGRARGNSPAQVD
jgi:hypothetical protein